MLSNSTDNIYSSEYRASAQPIPADIIGYDNTDSGLTATDAQAAIDELAEDVLKATASSGTITYAWVAEV